MKFSTAVQIEPSSFHIDPFEQMLFVGSCFADSMGQRFKDNLFRAVVNPYGVMYNPASVLHTIQRSDEAPRVAILTLGTNHVYILKETNEIVDNCQKRPQSLFREEKLSVESCAAYLAKAVDILYSRNPEVKVIVTISPIRYAKYGFHGSQLSKATLLLAADRLVGLYPDVVTYFPAYEIVNDELRDYRFYQEDMLHPTPQAVSYIEQRFSEVFFSDAAKRFVEEWLPIKKALSHRPFNPDSAEYQTFFKKALEDKQALLRRYGQVD